MNSLDYTKLRSLTAQKIEQALERDGFILRRKHDAIRIYRHPDGRRVTIHFHRGSQTFAIGTLKSIIEGQAQCLKTISNGSSYSRNRSFSSPHPAPDLAESCGLAIHQDANLEDLSCHTHHNENGHE